MERLKEASERIMSVFMQRILFILLRALSSSWKCIIAWITIWCAFGTSPHQSHSLFVILRRIPWLLYRQLLSLPAYFPVAYASYSCNIGIHPEMRDFSSSAYGLIHAWFCVVFFCPFYWFLATPLYRSFWGLSPILQASVSALGQRNVRYHHPLQ